MNTETFKAAQSTSMHTIRHNVGCMVKKRSKVNRVTGMLQANTGSTRACNVLGAMNLTKKRGQKTESICHRSTAGSLA